MQSQFKLGIPRVLFVGVFCFILLCYFIPLEPSDCVCPQYVYELFLPQKARASTAGEQDNERRTPCFPPRSFPAGAEFTGMIPRKICSHVPSAKSQKGDLSLIMSFFLKPFGGLPVVLRAKTKFLLKAFQALQIWPLLIPPFFLAPHRSHPDLPALSGALSPLPRTGPLSQCFTA